jgi:hypothetical protein
MVLAALPLKLACKARPQRVNMGSQTFRSMMTGVLFNVLRASLYFGTYTELEPDVSGAVRRPKFASSIRWLATSTREFTPIVHHSFLCVQASWLIEEGLQTTMLDGNWPRARVVQSCAEGNPLYQYFRVNGGTV